MTNTMKHTDTHRDLTGSEAVEKLQALVDKNNICMFCTSEDRMLRARPMAIQEVDADGNLWLLSGKESQKNKDIEIDPSVDLFFANSGDAEFLSIAGTAEILNDRQRIEELWKPLAKAWFTDGKDDPSITVIKVIPESSYYWDTQHGKMISMFKFMAGAIAGERMNEGIQGKITL
jgi:general stress protein 26